MSDPLRIALVAEGPTDVIVIRAALRAMLAARPFVLTVLQPEESAAFGSLGGGWGGVYKWCRQTAQAGGGRLSANGLLGGFDLLILHADADVADCRYEDYRITPEAGDPPLPCPQPCPPVAAAADAVRSVVLGWCREPAVPASVVLCVPSKNTEAWVVAALFPDDGQVVREDRPFECHPDPASRLGQQKKDVRIAKRVADYRRREANVSAAWPAIAVPDRMTQAARFQDDILAAIR